MTTPEQDARPALLLGAHASRRCPRRIHNDHDRTVPKVEWLPSPELQLRLDAGSGFEVEVLDRLVVLHGHRCTDLRGTDDWRELTTATIAALAAGAELVVGGRLPDDDAGGRLGRPDVLLRVGTGPDGVAGRYVPVEVKWHLGTEKRAKRTASVSALASPTTRVEVEGRAPRTRQRFDDLLQLAHYTRMLQACGFHPGEDQLVGAVIGTDLLDVGGGEPEQVLVWHDLAVAQFTTFSRSRGSAERSVLERYDHEHRFRLKVAQVAARRTGAPDDPEPIVVPIAQDECLTCPYRDWCAERMGPDDPSAAITTGRLRIREWLSLQALGVTTTAALAEVDVDDDEFMAAFLAEHTHDEAGAARRLAEAVRRAGMVRDGVRLLRTGTGPLHVPRADVEIDLDYESDPSGRKYLWGARVATGDALTGTWGPARYRAFVTWDLVDAEGERALAAELVAWLRSEIASAEVAGRTPAGAPLDGGRARRPAHRPRCRRGGGRARPLRRPVRRRQDAVRGRLRSRPQGGRAGLRLPLARRRRRRLAVADLAARRPRHRLARPRGDAAAGARVQRGRRRGDGGRPGRSLGPRDVAACRRVGSRQRRPTEDEGWGSRWVSRWPRAATSR